MIEATKQNFNAAVLDASRERLVLVDFWAPWCAPCRMLAPLLDALEPRYGARLEIVKVNVDENQDLAARYGVRSIPYVVAFADGAAVDSFVGVLPADSLRAFVDRLLPDAAELERRKAVALRARGDIEGAARALRAAIALGPDRDDARFDLIELLLEGGQAATDPARREEAVRTLAEVTPAGRQSARWRALDTRVQSEQRAAALPDATALAGRITADAGDLQARADLASVLVARRQFEAALEQLLAIVERDRSFGDDYGRRTMLSVFELAADQPQLVSTFRRRLAAALNR